MVTKIKNQIWTVYWKDLENKLRSNWNYCDKTINRLTTKIHVYRKFFTSAGSAWGNSIWFSSFFFFLHYFVVLVVTEILLRFFFVPFVIWFANTRMQSHWLWSCFWSKKKSNARNKAKLVTIGWKKKTNNTKSSKSVK